MRIRITMLVILVVLAFSTAMSQTTAEDFYKLAVENSTQQNLDLALEYFNRTIELDPKFVKAYFMRGHILANRRDYVRAVADFTKAIELEPKKWAWYSERGLTRLYARDNEGAITDFQKIIELNGDKRWAYHFIGRAYEDTAWNFITNGDIELGKAARSNAISSFTMAIAVDPKDAESYRYRSIAHSRNDNDQSALADINKAIDLKPAFVDYYRLRIDIYRKTGKKELAEADEKRIAELASR